MACGKLRKAVCKTSPNCEWVISKGCKSKVSRVPNAPRVPKATSKQKENQQSPSSNLKKEMGELTRKISKSISSTYHKSGGARDIQSTAPFHKVTNEVDYLTGKDIEMIMTGKGKSIQVASKSMSVGIEIINMNKTYITDEDLYIEARVEKNAPIHNDFSYFVKINKKAVTFLKKQLIVFQEEETNVSLPNLKKVKVA
jgi:hypothetical protein